jgi:CRP-like cAMP-binding protein
MALDEEQSSAAHEIRRAVDCLRECADLTGVDPATLEALAAGAVHFSLPAGSLLFDSGSTPDGVYLLASGRLGVKTPGMTHLTAEIGRSELVGETGWLPDLPRLPAAAVRTPRSSLAAELERRLAAAT